MPDGSDRIVRGRFFEAHPVVFPVSAGLIVLFVLTAVAFPGRCLMVFDLLQEWITVHFSWLYIVSMTGFLVFALLLCFSQYGDIRLGPKDEKPEFPTLTWFAMLFSAGMGIGMLFWGVAEPMYHYLYPPFAPDESLDAARKGMSIAIFHWGFHAWALYSLVALSLAYFGFRRGLPLSFRSVFYPLFGERIHGRIGDAIDVMAVLATLFGLATSLGLGAKQVNAGLNVVFGLPMGSQVQVVLIACITAMAVASLVSGLHVGIRRLSEINMMIAGFLLLFLFVSGPTVHLLKALVENTGTYLQRIPTQSFWTAAYAGGESDAWFGDWTVFYWGWWIAWSPFVGMFIARVSRGRTIREFITAVLLVPTAVGIVWMTGFGNSALHQEVYVRTAPSPLVQELRRSLEAEVGRAPTEAEVDAALARHWGYAPTEYPVLVEDEASGMPRVAGPEKGAWPLAIPNAEAVAKPRYYRARHRGEGIFETRDGQRVEYVRGVMVREGTRTPYWPPEEAEFAGEFAAETRALSLGGYLSNPVLNPSRTGKQDTVATAMFVMLAAHPLPWLTSLLGTISVILFFVTSSDSASLVADMIASGGNPDPPTGTRLFWGILEGTLAAVLLLAGGLVALQTGSIALGLPFCGVVILMCVSLAHGLRRERDGQIPDDQKRHLEGGADETSR